MKHAIILGGGITGLSLAWFLNQHNPHLKLTLLESSSRLGGWISTKRESGFLFEEGPRSIRPQGLGLSTLKLVQNLGLEKEVIVSSPCASNRFLYINGQLTLIPQTIKTFLTSPLTKGIWKTLWHELWTPALHVDDESVYEFASRRFNPEIANLFFDPLISGIYAGNMRKLSIRSAFPSIYQLEKRYGSILKGMFFKKRQKIEDPFLKKMSTLPLFTFKNGMETLIKALTNKINAQIFTSAHIQKIEILNGKIRLIDQNGLYFEADHLFSTIASHTLSQLLGCNFTSHIPYASVACVNIGYRKKVWDTQGFGYLIPHQEKESILGAVWDSCIFPEQNSNDSTKMCVMLGGMQNLDLLANSEGKIIEIALSSLKKHLHIHTPPDVISLNIASQAIPQYEVGHHKLIVSLTEQFKRYPNLTILGSFLNGVSVNDCINAARQASFINS